MVQLLDYKYRSPARRGEGGGGAGGGVAHLNCKTSHVGVYKRLSLIVCFAVIVAIWPREVVSCRDFILRVVATFWSIEFTLAGPQYSQASHKQPPKIQRFSDC